MAFCWTELNTRDPAGARSFYSATMGWSFRRADIPAEYWFVMKEETMIGGLYGMHGYEFEDTPSHWFSYAEVEDVDAACRIALESGGDVLREPATIAPIGRVAILKDPSGALIGCITPGGTGGGLSGFTSRPASLA